MGLLNPLYDAVSWIIVQFHTLFSLVFPEDSGWAWGLSIVCLVILIRICLIPLFVRQIRATRNMQALQPKMRAIQERYKNDRQRQSEEMMKLYRETGTNPLASCLPILAQSPFFYALYHVLTYTSQGKTVGVMDQELVNSAREAHIFGAPIAARFTDSAATVEALNADLITVRIVTVVMIVLMSLSQFITQRQLMVKNVDTTVQNPMMQQQRMLMYLMPIMFAIFGINFPVGVLVYWLTTNAWSMGQQLYVIRRNPTPGSKAFHERQERLRAKGKLPEQKAAAKAAKAAGEDVAKAIEEATKPAKPAPVARTQPKRTTKAQRQGGAAGRPQSGAAGGKQPGQQPGKPAGGADSGTDASSSGARNASATRPQDAAQRQGGNRTKSPSRPQRPGSPKKK
ncbi:membrane protein insertase YidC [Allostreptomyces psammosilenae]|uniref:Membrane protein insertase YidC n=1 Tax=Allostreptomyces psammosilenae TaxID=1892865 RepID=A0A853A4I3_9ACTN|nr:membrane protein insertase YidC [Allostreptomyces psammosilenae]NYI05408.1 YidC/Oxa1 family membrane protein insertase [Allostreptomyces psammosilenae]